MTSKTPETETFEDKVISEWGMSLENRIKQLNNLLRTDTCNQAYYDDMLHRATTTALEAAKREAEDKGALAELRWLKVYIKARQLKPEQLNAVLDYQISGYENKLSHHNQLKQDGGGE
jgi:hypothetical protein